MIFKFFKYFSLRGKWQLFWGSINYKLYDSVPKNIFETRNFLEALKASNCSVLQEPTSFIVVKGKMKFSVRRNSSDLKVFRQVILDEEFKNVVTLINKHNIKIRTILDAGANIGLTTLYLKDQYSKARVLCVEPDESNQKQLLKNVELNALSEVKIVNGGIWSHNSWLNIDHTFRDGLEWSRRLFPAKTGIGNIPVYTVNYLMNKEEWTSIDLLKVDIEGAEEAIFSKSSNLAFLNKTKIITIEIHDMFQVGHSIIERLLDHNFKIYFSGELIIGVRE